jgi:ATP-dependent DNA helicase RecG
MFKSDFIDKIINELEASIAKGQFIDAEQEQVELKDLSTGNDWTSLKETICAFLNTNGGYIFCGVREKNKQYVVTGFDRNNENNIILLSNECFINNQGTMPDLNDFIHFDYKNLLGKTIAIIMVRPLPEDLKYLSFNGNYYERVLTQDKIITPAKILQQKEYKQELEYAKE